MKIYFEDTSKQVKFETLKDGYYRVKTRFDESILIITEYSNNYLFIDKHDNHCTFIHKEDFEWMNNNVVLLEKIETIEW